MLEYLMNKKYTDMTLREYAAIHLMLPDSGNSELDKMILKSIQLKSGKAAFSAPDRPQMEYGADRDEWLNRKW